MSNQASKAISQHFPGIQKILPSHLKLKTLGRASEINQRAKVKAKSTSSKANLNQRNQSQLKNLQFPNQSLKSVAMKAY
jgi:hypothetical protein